MSSSAAEEEPTGDDLFQKRMTRWKENHQRMMDDTSGVPSSKREAYKQSVRILWRGVGDEGGAHERLWETDDERALLWGSTTNRIYTQPAYFNGLWIVYHPQMLFLESSAAMHYTRLRFDPLFETHSTSRTIDLTHFTGLKTIEWIRCTINGTIQLPELPNLERLVLYAFNTEDKHGWLNKLLTFANKAVSTVSNVAQFLYNVAQLYHKGAHLTAGSELLTGIYGIITYVIKKGSLALKTILRNLLPTSIIDNIDWLIKTFRQSIFFWAGIETDETCRETELQNNPDHLPIQQISPSEIRPGIQSILTSFCPTNDSCLPSLSTLDLSFCDMNDSSHPLLLDVLKRIPKTTASQFTLIVVGVDFYNEEGLDSGAHLTALFDAFYSSTPTDPSTDSKQPFTLADYYTTHYTNHFDKAKAHRRLEIIDNYTNCSDLHRIATTCDNTTIRRYLEQYRGECTAFLRGDTVTTYMWTNYKAFYIPHNALDRSYYQKTPYEMQITKPFLMRRMASLSLILPAVALAGITNYTTFSLTLIGKIIVTGLAGSPFDFLIHDKYITQGAPEERVTENVLEPSQFCTALIGATIQLIGNPKEYYVKRVSYVSVFAKITEITNYLEASTWIPDFIKKFITRCCEFCKPTSEEDSPSSSGSGYSTQYKNKRRKHRKTGYIQKLIEFVTACKDKCLQYLDSHSLHKVNDFASSFFQMVRFAIRAMSYMAPHLIKMMTIVYLSSIVSLPSLGVMTGGAFLMGIWKPAFLKDFLTKIRNTYDEMVYLPTLELIPQDSSGGNNLVYHKLQRDKSTFSIQHFPSMHTPPPYTPDRSRFIVLNEDYTRTMDTATESTSSSCVPRALSKGVYYVNASDQLMECIKGSTSDWYDDNRASYQYYMDQGMGLISYYDLHLFQNEKHQFLHVDNINNNSHSDTSTTALQEPIVLLTVNGGQPICLREDNKSVEADDGDRDANLPTFECVHPIAIEREVVLKRTIHQVDPNENRAFRMICTIDAPAEEEDDSGTGAQSFTFTFTLPIQDNELRIHLRCVHPSKQSELHNIRITCEYESSENNDKKLIYYQDGANTQNANITGDIVCNPSTNNEPFYRHDPRNNTLFVFASAPVLLHLLPPSDSNSISHHINLKDIDTLCVERWDEPTPSNEDAIYSALMQLCNEHSQITHLKFNDSPKKQSTWATSHTVNFQHITTLSIGREPPTDNHTTDDTSVRDTVNEFKTSIQAPNNATSTGTISVLNHTFRDNPFPNLATLNIYTGIDDSGEIQFKTFPPNLKTIVVGHLHHLPILALLEEALKDVLQKPVIEGVTAAPVTLDVRRLFADDKDGIHAHTKRLHDLYCVLNYGIPYHKTGGATDYVSKYGYNDIMTDIPTIQENNPGHKAVLLLNVKNCTCYTASDISSANANLRQNGSTLDFDNDTNSRDDIVARLTDPSAKQTQVNSAPVVLQVLESWLNTPVQDEDPDFFKNGWKVYDDHGQERLYRPHYGESLKEHFIMQRVFNKIMMKPSDIPDSDTYKAVESTLYIPPQDTPHCLLFEMSPDNKGVTIKMYSRLRNGVAPVCEEPIQKTTFKSLQDNEHYTHLPIHTDTKDTNSKKRYTERTFDQLESFYHTATIGPPTTEVDTLKKEIHRLQTQLDQPQQQTLSSVSDDNNDHKYYLYEMNSGILFYSNDNGKVQLPKLPQDYYSIKYMVMQKLPKPFNLFVNHNTTYKLCAFTVEYNAAEQTVSMENNNVPKICYVEGNLEFTPAPKDKKPNLSTLYTTIVTELSNMKIRGRDAVNHLQQGMQQGLTTSPADLLAGAKHLEGWKNEGFKNATILDSFKNAIMSGIETNISPIKKLMGLSGGRTRHRRPLRTRRTRHTRMPHTSSHTIRHSPKRSSHHKRPHRFTQRHQRKSRGE